MPFSEIADSFLFRHLYSCIMRHYTVVGTMYSTATPPLVALASLAGLYVVTIASIDTGDTVCYDGLGCFENGHPWKSPLRPVPPPQRPEKIPTTLFFFSRQNTSKPYVIETYPDVDIGNVPISGVRPTLFIIHGFYRGATSKWMKQLKDVYLNKIDANVFLVDWSVGAFMEYLQSVSDTRVVGRVLANFLTVVIEEKGLKPEMVHLVGHSLGAHIASYVAKKIPGIGRLTALDPAQPGFEYCDARVRLDKSDATFVEVVHSDPKPFVPFLGFGMTKPHGHVDFYFNPGFVQPGCIVPDDIPTISSLADLATFPSEYAYNQLFCSHERSHAYLVESYNVSNSCIFWGHKSSLSTTVRSVANSLAEGIASPIKVQMKTCTPADCVAFGLDTIHTSLRGVFTVATNSKYPFCIAETAMLPESSQTWNV